MTDSKTITLRCRAFRSEGVRENKLLVDSDGTVRVWDSVAGHYTTCHSLSSGAIRRARQAAASETSPTTRRAIGGGVRGEVITAAAIEWPD